MSSITRSYVNYCNNRPRQVLNNNLGILKIQRSLLKYQSAKNSMALLTLPIFKALALFKAFALVNFARLDINQSY